MIKVNKIKRYDSKTSSKSAIPFRPDVNSARGYFHLHYSNYKRGKDGYTYFYQIEKYNLKKKNTKKTQLSSRGNEVPKRTIVQDKKVVLTVYRFKTENIVKSKQNSRSFYVELSF